jgi:hypothetical protein
MADASDRPLASSRRIDQANPKHSTNWSPSNDNPRERPSAIRMADMQLTLVLISDLELPFWGRKLLRNGRKD